MKTYAVLSDIHSNFTAFKACISEAEKRNVDGYIFLGDYITDSAYPRDTLELIYKLKENHECYFVKGNREQYLLDHRFSDEKWEPSSKTGLLYYAYRNIEKKDFDFFDSLHHYRRLELCGCDIGICHGSPESHFKSIYCNETGKWFEKMDTRVLLCGHTHRPMLICSGENYIVNPGSVGTPVDGINKAKMAFMYLDDDKIDFSLQELQYDIESEINRIKRSGLEELAMTMTKALEMNIITGENYVMNCLRLSKELYMADGHSADEYVPEKYWKTAAEKLGIK